MLILETQAIPASVVELSGVVDRSIRKWIGLPAGAKVVVTEGELPTMKSAKIDLTGGTVDTSKGVPPYTQTSTTEPGPVIGGVEVVADPLTVDGIALGFHLTASNVAFGYARSDAGQLVVALDSADDGKLSIQLSKQNLEAAILKAAQTGAASSGVSILKVDSTLTSISPRVLDVNLKITAKKFVTTVIHVTGRLSVDDQLNATATDLKADGDGMVASIAVSFIRPHLEKLQGRPISLMQFSLGKVSLRDVAVDTENGLQITAGFGSGKP